MLDREQLLACCGAKPGAVAEQPFGPGVAVYKAGGRMFALVTLDGAPEISLKCDPDDALELRAVYDAVRPGYHLNKRHWNTVTVDGSIPDDEVIEMIDRSYGLVVAALPRRVRDGLGRA
ncbi:MAG: MmcQ/YjbR family DNA-binding protein [Euzebyales bacterium]|nr:MmcQ/YjbR family DNA-binding protein [Euzebyales bacterium]MBA3621672.1 MmcQ/YjbR family DNA-binding protein [Euzebyales bacterium]